MIIPAGVSLSKQSNEMLAVKKLGRTIYFTYMGILSNLFKMRG